MEIEEIKEYLNAIKIDKSDATIKLYAESISRFFSFVGVKNFDDVKNVKPSDCREYQSKMKDGGSKPNSINSYIRPLRAMYNWLADNEYIETNPLSKVKDIKVPKDEVAFLSDAEIEKLINGCPRSFDKLIFSLLITSGLRRSELVSIKINDFSDNKILINGKGLKQRRLMIVPEVAFLLRQYIKWRIAKYGYEREEIFISPYGKPYHGGSIRNRLEEVMKSAGFDPKRIEQIHTHSLRHTFVANLFDGGGDLYMAQRALGHESTNTTQRYAHLRDGKLDNAILNQKVFLR